VVDASLTSYTVSVDLSLTMIQMIEAGKYSNHRDAITNVTEERFPVDRSGALQYEKELHLIAPSRDGITTTEWKAELEAADWELERTPEILAFGAKYPDLQREHYIVAFGSVWQNPDGYLFSPVLWCGGGERELVTRWCKPDREWNRVGRALVSRKRR
jgi:hypothetical protein